MLSLCAALGLQWAALQTVAWVGMLFHYSGSGSVASAFEKTFDGRHPCPLCNAIHKSEQSGKKQELLTSGKMDLECPRRQALPVPPMRNFSWPAFGPEGLAYAQEPSVPPPRAA